ncbi:MAG: alkene reductase, partial [Pseudomonadota bacterium]|nr:alkene reductase [Pseudomonadota bacterium]
MSDTNLFTPMTVGGMALSHRVVMAPLTRMRATVPDHAANDMMAEYYGQRASEGGLIIAEASQISEDGRGAPCTPGTHSASQVAGWRQVTEAVHAKGGKIYLQLWHMGRLSHPLYQPDGGAPLAPSPVAAAGKVLLPDFSRTEMPTPRAMSTAEVAGLAARYAHA